MCGIVGIFTPNLGQGDIEYVVQSMTSAIRHRGPDGSGIWVDDNGVGFGHARLSIIDLTDAGKQPMRSHSGKYVICYNGEIYNFKEIRLQLENNNIQVSGNSDTEVLVESIDYFGLDWTLKNTHGMFAIALWNTQTKTLTLARDRFGEKPLYYGNIEGDFVFASELKPFRLHPKFTFEVDKSALSAYVKYKYVPSPLCMLKGFKKLPAAHCISGKTTIELMEKQPESFWSPEELKKSNNQETDLENILTKVINRQMISDVPIGSFLSGGLDSSVVTALMQKQSTNPINTFTIGFNEKDHDESVYAKKISDHLGTNHTEWIVTQKDVQDLIPKMTDVYDEPFADASQLPTTLLSQLTRNSVTVCLSGDGADELFAGYTRYLWGEKIYRWSNRTPSIVKKGVQSLYSSRDLTDWVSTYYKLENYLPINITQVGDKLFKLNEICSKSSPESIYDSLLSCWDDPTSVLLDGEESSIVLNSFNHSRTFTENMMMHDSQHYLIDDIMVKVDRAAMSVGLESRAPFLDHEIFEYAWSLPIEKKLNKGVSKLPIREILARYIPIELIERPKKGFSVPLEHWFRSDLKELLHDNLNTDLLASQSVFNPKIIQQYVDEHQSGKSNRQDHLWTILVFQAWYKEWDTPL